MAYLKNTITKFNKRLIEGKNVNDYFSINFQEIDEYVKTRPNDWFDYYQLEDDDTLENVALNIYGDADFWDIILIINRKNALYDMPFNFDGIVSSAEYKFDNFVEYSGLTVSISTKNKMLKAYEEKYSKDNEIFRTIKIVKPSKIQTFLQGGYEAGYFK